MMPLNVSFNFVSPGSALYEEAVALRYRVFFEPTQTPIDQLLDSWEAVSLHAVAVSDPDGALLGYGRMTSFDSYVQVSQFVVSEEHRGNWKVWHGLYRFIRGKAESEGKMRLAADARLPSMNLYRRIGFVETGLPFPSKKTGIIHQRMEMDLCSPPAIAPAMIRRNV